MSPYTMYLPAFSVKYFILSQQCGFCKELVIQVISFNNTFIICNVLFKLTQTSVVQDKRGQTAALDNVIVLHI